MLLSIIIAAYNAEKTIGRTLESVKPLLSSKDVEVIVVNDGSTDNTLKVIEDSSINVVLINQENKGVSVARNAGIKQAQGEYLWFVDADDMVDAKEAMILLDKIRGKNLDFIWFANVNVIDGKEEKAHNMPEGVFEGMFSVAQWREFYKGAGMLWQYWLKRNIIIKNDIRFMEWAKWFEDAHFLLCFTSEAKNVYITPCVLYYYVFNPTGAMRNSLLEERHKCSIKLSIDLLNRGGYDKRSQKFVEAITAVSIAWCIREAGDSYANELYASCKSAGVFPLRICGSWKQRLQIGLLNLNFMLYRRFCKII